MGGRAMIRIIAFICWLAIASLGLSQNPFDSSPFQREPIPTAPDEIIRSLQEKSGAELRHFIPNLKIENQAQGFSDEEIVRIISALREIAESDPYQVMVTDTIFNGKGAPTTKSKPRPSYPARAEAGTSIEQLVELQERRRFRTLPMETRVDEFMPRFKAGNKFEHILDEIIQSGEPCASLILKHELAPKIRTERMLQLLGRVGDPDGKDYVIERLRTPGEGNMRLRWEAAWQLAWINDPAVVRALIEALKDESYWVENVHMTQLAKPPKYDWNARYYCVQHAAGQSLSILLNQDFSWIYREDYKSWNAWLDSAGDSNFDPAKITRTDSELRALIEKLFHRMMSTRPEGLPKKAAMPYMYNWEARFRPSGRKNPLCTSTGMDLIALDLEPHGERVVGMLLEECRARFAESPNFEPELWEWTYNILTRLPWPSAKESAKSIETLFPKFEDVVDRVRAYNGYWDPATREFRWD